MRCCIYCSSNCRLRTCESPPVGKLSVRKKARSSSLVISSPMPWSFHGPSLCVMFIIETLSDIIQVGYFKATHGKRVFRMAPFHHHLELGGWTGRKWKEKEIFVLYTGVSLLCMVFSFLIVFERF